MALCKVYRVAILLGSTLLLNSVASRADEIGDVATTFDTAVQQSAGAVDKFYSNLNDYERTLYFDELLFHPTKKMVATQGGSSTAMINRFSDKDIHARLLAVQLIGSYSHGLVQLADPARAKSVQDSLSALGSSIQRINQDIKSLTGEGSSTAANFAGPAGQLAGLIAGPFMKLKREEALKRFIQNGAPQVDQLCTSLEGDIKNVMEGIYKNDAQRDLLAFSTYYNQKLSMGTATSTSSATIDETPRDSAVDATRIAFLQSACSSADRYAHIESANPIQLVQKMHKVEKDLVAWASAGKKVKPKDIPELVDDLQAYVDEVRHFVNVVGEFKQ